MSPSEILRTERLVLRDAGPQDVDAMFAIATDFDVIRNTGTWPWPADRDFTASRCQPLAPDFGLGGSVLKNGRVIGMASVTEGGLGYMLARAHWGQGYATEICHALVNEAFARGLWKQLHACVFTDNPGSARVLKKLGFKEGSGCTGHCASRGQDLPIYNFTLDAPQA